MAHTRSHRIASQMPRSRLRSPDGDSSISSVLPIILRIYQTATALRCSFYMGSISTIVPYMCTALQVPTNADATFSISVQNPCIGGRTGARPSRRGRRVGTRTPPILPLIRLLLRRENGGKSAAADCFGDGKTIEKCQKWPLDGGGGGVL